MIIMDTNWEILLQKTKEKYPDENIRSIDDLKTFFLTHDNNMSGRWYFVCPPKKLLFVANAKTGIKSNLLNLVNLYDDLAVINGEPSPFYFTNNNLTSHVIMRRVPTTEELSYYRYTVVRNPLTRMVSLYEYMCLYQAEDIPLMFDNSSFEKFIESIYIIPDELIDRHGRSQYDMTGAQDIYVDALLRFENLESDYELIKNKFDLKPLQHGHKGSYTKPWEEYYTIETAHMVYQRYRDDFRKFGYEQEFVELLKKLDKKQA